MSTQLTCLRRRLGDADPNGDVHAAWAQLSSACHAHPYELDPTLVELQRWVGVARRLLGLQPTA